MLKDSFIFYTPILISIVLISTFEIFKRTDKISVITTIFVFLIYYLIHGNRYGSLGNDYPSHALALLIFVLFVNSFHENDHKQINLKFLQLTSISLICFLSKLSFLLIFLFPIIFFIKNRKKINNNFKFNLLFFSCLFLFFLN